LLLIKLLDLQKMSKHSSIAQQSPHLEPMNNNSGSAKQSKQGSAFKQINNQDNPEK